MASHKGTFPTGTSHNQGKTYRKHMTQHGKACPTKSGNARGKMKTH